MPNIDGPRGCTKAELPEMIALVDAAMRKGSDQSMLTDYPLVYLDKNLENNRVLRADGEMASVVPFIPRPIVIDGCRFTIGIISPTATAVHHRKKGYGLQCLHSCIEVMNQAGCELSVLWTLVTTFPFYESGEYQAVRSQGWIYRCGRKDAALFANHGEETVAYSPVSGRHLEAIQQMHERQIYGVLRTPEEYRILFALPKMRTLIARRKEAPVAYLVVSNAINKPGLIEAGGDEAALETLVNRALSELKGDQYFDAYDNLTETVLGKLLQRNMPERRQASTKSMMVRINNFPAFFHKIARWLEKKNAGASREFSLGLTGTNEVVGFRFTKVGLALTANRLKQHLEMSRQELTAAVFGAHPARPTTPPEITRDLFPLYFPIWILDHS